MSRRTVGALLSLLLCAAALNTPAGAQSPAVTISVDAAAARRPISP